MSVVRVRLQKVAISYLLQLLHARVVDHNLAGSPLPPQSRFLQEEREKGVHEGVLFPGGKKLAVKQEMVRSLGNILSLTRHPLVLSSVLYIGKRSEVLPVKIRSLRKRQSHSTPACELEVKGSR